MLFSDELLITIFNTNQKVQMIPRIGKMSVRSETTASKYPLKIVKYLCLLI